MSVHLTCPDCGHSTTSRTIGLAEHGMRRHSCAAERLRRERAERVARRRTDSGPEAPCQHDGRHPHGNRVRYVIDKCRCRRCRDAASQYQRQLNRRHAYGQDVYVDAQPARVHVQSLQVWGMGWKRIAHTAGVHTSVVWKLLYGAPTRNMGPSKRIRKTTADALLAVRLDLADGALVDATGARRRLQALATLGWSIQALADHAHVDRQRLDKALRNDWIRKTTRDVVAALYDDLWNTPATGGRSTATRLRAERHGWVPPLAWDDDQIDNPAATPADTTTPNPADRRRVPAIDLDDVAWLLRAGEAPEHVARRVGARLYSIREAAKREHRDDILTLLAEVAA